MTSCSHSQAAAVSSSQNDIDIKRQHRITPPSPSLIRQKIKTETSLLLKCCLRSDWGSVLLICDLLVDNWDDDAGGRLARQHMLTTDAGGNFPLHAVCHRHPPSRVVQKLVNLATRLRLTPCLETNNRQQAPLLIACIAGVSNDVVQLLLEAPGGHVTVAMADDEGVSPISGLVNHYNTLRRIPMLAAISVPIDDIKSLTSNDADCFASTWSTIEMLLTHPSTTSSTSSMPKNDRRVIVESAARLAPFLPTCIGRLILRSFKTDIPHSCLEVMLVSATPSSDRSVMSIMDCDSQLVQRSQHADFVKHLILQKPELVSRRNPVTGRLPFHAAIQAGHGFSLNTDEGCLPLRLFEQGAYLERMWEILPDSITERDTVTSLYPFQLAATVDQVQQYDDGEDHHCTQQLTTIYSLLRMNPQAAYDNLLS